MSEKVARITNKYAHKMGTNAKRMREQLKALSHKVRGKMLAAFKRISGAQ